MPTPVTSLCRTLVRPRTHPSSRSFTPQLPRGLDTFAERKWAADVGGARANYFAKHGLQLRQPSLNEIHGWVSELNLYKEQLARENILEIMRFLAFDGLVERVERRNGRVEYHPLALGPDYNFGWERSEKTTILLADRFR